MKEIQFRMDREGLIHEGDKVEVTEKQAPMHYYYILEPAVAMSGCIQNRERVEDRVGVVSKIEDTPRGYQVTVSFVK